MTTRITLMALILMIFSAFPALSENSDVTVKYAEITTLKVPIRREIDPKSEVVKIAKEGDVFEIVSEGNLWIQVSTDDGIGWAPTSVCRIIDRKKTTLFSSPGNTIAFVGLVFIGLSLVMFLILRNRDEDETSF